MRITTTVNGTEHEVDDVWAGESLLYMLRERMGLPGSKNACEQGECGSCTVYLDGEPVCSCLVAAGQAIGREVTTVEGLASEGAAASGAGGVRRVRGRAVRVLHPGPARRGARPARPRAATPPIWRSGRRWPGTSAGAPATRRSWTPSGWPPSDRRRHEHRRGYARPPPPPPPPRRPAGSGTARCGPTGRSRSPASSPTPATCGTTTWCGA